MTYVADKRPIQSTQALTNGSGEFGLADWWHPNYTGPQETVRDNLLIHAPKAGKKRWMLWQIAGGGGAPTWLTSSAWHIHGPKQRWAMTEAFRIWRSAEADREIILFGGWGGDPFRRQLTQYSGTNDIYWLQQLLPLIAIGVGGWGLDSGSYGPLQAEATKAQAFLAKFGVKAIAEAVPVLQSASGAWVLDLARMMSMPSLVYWNLFATNPVYSDWRKWAPLPAGIEAHILLMAGHGKPGEQGYVPPPTKADVDLATSLGWTMGQVDMWDIPLA